MSDATGIHSEPLEPTVVTAAPRGGIRGFLSTTLGKVVVGCLAASILLAIVAVVLVIALGAFGINQLGKAADQASTTGASSTTTSAGKPSASGATTGTAPAASVVPTPAVLTVTDEDVFTPRDPFIPVVLPAPPAVPTAVASGSGGSSSGSITTASSSMLYLVGISGSGSTALAKLDYKGVIHSLAAGGAIPNSPWKVLSVNASAKTVTMLFGDERVTVALGEGVQSK